MSLCMTHVPAPAALATRRGGFSLGRRVASSGPVASSSSSATATSSFASLSRSKGSNRRTLELRTRAAGKNGGRDAARHDIAIQRNALCTRIIPCLLS